MMLWLNGPFGGGKTSVAQALVASTPGVRIFDPEWVGWLVRASLPDVPHTDFQDLPPWRTLVPKVAAEIGRHTGDTLIAVQTVLSPAYWAELVTGLEREGISPVMVLLDCEPEELERRARTDQVERGAEEWRLNHIDAYLEARTWLTQESALVVDTTHFTVGDVAARVQEVTLTPDADR